MSQDYGPAVWMPSPHCWAGQNAPRYVIVHGTGSSLSDSAQDIARYFQTGENGAPSSTHYVIGRDGEVVQCVREADAAWGNGPIQAGEKHGAWWGVAPHPSNPNRETISIEHVNDRQNSTALTDAQKQASFALIRDLCERYHIPMREADASGGITGHYSIESVDRAHCPGNYPWAELFAALGTAGATSGSLGGAPVAAGVAAGQDTGFYGLVTTSDPQVWLCAANGHHLGHGFREFYVSVKGPDGQSATQIFGLPVSEEYGIENGKIAQQFERVPRMVYDPAGKTPWAIYCDNGGSELAALRDQLAIADKATADLQQQLAAARTAADAAVALQAQVSALQQQLAAAQAAPSAPAPAPSLTLDGCIADLVALIAAEVEKQQQAAAQTH